MTRLDFGSQFRACLSLAFIIISLSASIAPGVTGAASPETPSFGFEDPSPEAQLGALRDRAQLINLLNGYSHFADGLETDRFGEFFTRDATFTIVPLGAASSDDPSGEVQTLTGRKAIVDSLRGRHAHFRKNGIQRRHFLSNAIVWNQSRTSAQVSVYLDLLSSTRGAPAERIGTGRYEGRAVRGEDGVWRIAEWTLHLDQVMGAPEGSEGSSD